MFSNIRTIFGMRSDEIETKRCTSSIQYKGEDTGTGDASVDGNPTPYTLQVRTGQGAKN